MDLNQITLPAVDVAASVAFYQTLGFELVVQAPHYARFKSLQGTASFSVHAVDAAAPVSNLVVYFECGALDLRVAQLQGKGVVFTQAPRDEPWLWREARLLDPSGNVLCLYQAGTHRLNPPWRVGGQRQPGLTPRTLETPRLQLRPLQFSDLPDLLEFNRDAEVNRYLPYAAWTSMDDALAWYHRIAGRVSSGDLVYSVVLEKVSGRAVGTALLMEHDAQCAKAEVGYLLGRHFWGRGYMREAVGAVVNDAFESLGLRRIEAHIDARNAPSQKLVRGLGFVQEALLRDNWCDKGEVSDSTVYGLLRRDWVNRLLD